MTTNDRIITMFACICKCGCLDTHFIANNSDLVELIKPIINDISCDQQDKGQFIE